VSFSWSTGATDRTIIVPAVEGDSYQVTMTDGCDLTASTSITLGSFIPEVQGQVGFECANGQGSLVASGANVDSLLWSTGSSDSRIFITEPGDYSARFFDICGDLVSTESITVTEEDFGGVADGNIESVCADTSGLLLRIIDADGVATQEWSTGQTVESILVRLPGTYEVALFNNCGIESPNRPSITITQEDLDQCLVKTSLLPLT